MDYIRRAEKSAESCQRAEVRALAKAHVGTSHYFSGRLDEAEVDLREAVGILDKVGDWFGMFCQSHPAPYLRGPGRHPAGTRRGREPRSPRARHAATRRCSGLGPYRQGRCPRQGRPDRRGPNLITHAIESLVARSLDRTGSPTGCSASSASRRRTTPGHAQQLERSRDLSTIGHSAFIEFAGPTYPFSSRACSAPAGPTRTDGPSRAVARKAWRESRFARFVGWRFPNYGPHALRVSGRAAFALGKTKRAADYFERAIIAAEKLGAATTSPAPCSTPHASSPKRADEYRRRGQQLLDELGAVVPEAERLPS